MKNSISEVLIEPFTLHIIVVVLLLGVLVYIAKEVTSNRKQNAERLSALSSRVKKVEDRQEVSDTHVYQIEKIIKDARVERQQQQGEIRNDIKNLSEQIFQLATRNSGNG